MMADAVIAQLDAGVARHVVLHLPKALHGHPAGQHSLPCNRGRLFSGSMNYLGRARNRDGSPQYEATYEINAALEISVPEFIQRSSRTRSCPAT